ncbi:DNA-binding MarR family transcriptional regulator [Bradyrhizobium sp. LB12.1]|uniref:hypothetical protein n=1 Tax=Bradyrhizobium sp. LB12.1 TaxID=3156327 RepID=UPI0033912908
MASRPVHPDKVLENPLRLGILRYLESVGGENTAARTYKCIGVDPTSANFAVRILDGFGLLRKHRDKKFNWFLTITDAGRAALAAAELKAAEEAEQFVCAHCGRASRRHQVMEEAA